MFICCHIPLIPKQHFPRLWTLHKIPAQTMLSQVMQGFVVKRSATGIVCVRVWENKQIAE